MRIYFNECMPIMFPSVSKARETNPYSPIENFSRATRPPLFAARSCSTAQSSHPK